jgi:hypothetical protein
LDYTATSLARAAVSTIAFVVAVAVVAVLSLPPRPIAITNVSWNSNKAIVAGAFHIHTIRSDGSGSVDDVAAAAARAGLRFVVITDHGDGTRPPLAPAYRSGVLCIDGVEISTTDGHYATVGMPQTPYPLGGEARDVVEDVRRLGGFGVAAHGDSPKSEAQWRDWNAPIDGLEWLNLDSSWREAGPSSLARGLLTYWFRPPETLAWLTRRPDQTLARFDALAGQRRLVALAATDAHARGLPSYDACFKGFSTRVELDAPPGGNADADARAIVAALKAGHHYTTIDALAQPSAFEFLAHSGSAEAREGDTLPKGQAAILQSRVAAPPGSTSVLLKNGSVVHETHEESWRFETDGRQAEYRVEVRIPGAPGTPPIPWIVSNPIYVGWPESINEASDAPRTNPRAGTQPLLAWRSETDSASTGLVRPKGNAAIDLRYTLGPGAPTGQHAGAVAPVPANFPQYSGLSFSARADRPLRISVQLRADGDPGAPRWQRSVYLDQIARNIQVVFSDMRPTPPNAAALTPRASVGSLMLLVDTTNTEPGSSGLVEFKEIAFEK